MLFGTRQILVTIAGILFFGAALRAQQDDRLGKISCRGQGSLQPQNRAYTKELWDGYEISLGPARNAHGDGDDCTAAIYNQSRKVVFRTTGFSVVFDKNHTGEDFDGDGKPEVVFITDTGGGMHCCWAYNVISQAFRQLTMPVHGPRRVGLAFLSPFEASTRRGDGARDSIR